MTYEEFLEKQNDEIIERLCKEDIESWRKIFEKKEPVLTITEEKFVNLLAEKILMQIKLDHVARELKKVILIGGHLGSWAQKLLDDITKV